MFEIVLEATGGVVVAILLLVILLLVSLKVTSYIYDLKKVEGYTNYEKDLIYLHTFPRACGKQVPNISPYAIKLETWLRLRKLKYKVRETVFKFYLMFCLMLSILPKTSEVKQLITATAQANWV